MRAYGVANEDFGQPIIAEQQLTEFVRVMSMAEGWRVIADAGAGRGRAFPASSTRSRRRRLAMGARREPGCCTRLPSRELIADSVETWSTRNARTR